MNRRSLRAAAPLLLLAAGAACASVPAPAGPAADLALTGRIIDGTGDAPIERGVVLVAGERIVCAGERRACPIPPGTRVLDAGEGSILPGLIDLHVHVWDRGMLSMFLPAGVTTVRDLHNSLENLAILDGAPRPAPRLVRAGPLIDGPGGMWPGAILAGTPAEGRAAVDRVLDAGADLVKLYAGLPPEVYAAAAARARERGADVTTDLMGSRVDALQALEMGVRGNEHASGFQQAYARLGGGDSRVQSELDATILDRMARAVVEQGGYLVPTLIVMEQYAADAAPDVSAVPMADRVGDPVLGFWQRRESLSPQMREVTRSHLRMAAELVRRVHALGGLVGAGSDLPNPYVVPGGGLHQELELLVRAGLTPLEAVRAATGHAAAILRRDDLGVIAPGRLADLVVVEGDPSRRIADAARVRAVVQGGMVHPLDALLGQAPPVRGERDPTAVPPLAEVDGRRLRAGTVAYEVTLQGRAAGVDTLRIRREGDRWMVARRTHTPLFSTRIDGIFAVSNLAPGHVEMWQESGGMEQEVTLTYADGRVRGELRLPAAMGGAQPVDAAAPTGTLDGSLLEPLVLGLPLAEGGRWSVPVYSAYVRGVVAYAFTVEGAEDVEVGGARVPTWRVSLSAGGFEQSFWVSREAPHWLVAVEIPMFSYRATAREMPR